MKAFVIKNKEGMYKNPHLDIREFYTGNITEAEIWTKKKDAEYFCPKDCQVIEVTIAEGDLDKEIEHWHNLFKQKEQQFQSVRERYHLLNRLQANYDKKHKLHLSEMQCLELVEKNEDLEQQLAEKDKQLAIIEKALELALSKLYGAEYIALYKNNFIEQAKESIDEDRNKI